MQQSINPPELLPFALQENRYGNKLNKIIQIYIYFFKKFAQEPKIADKNTTKN